MLKLSYTSFSSHLHERKKDSGEVIKNKQPKFSMKNTIVTLFTLGCLIGSAVANTVTFNNWKTAGFTDNTSTNNTATITQDGVTFSLTATTSGNLDLNPNGTLFGVGGNVRMNAGNSVTFSLAVSGAALESLSLDNLTTSYFNDPSEKLSLSDGTTTLPTFSPNLPRLEYGTGNALDGLIPLTKDNPDTWQLTMQAMTASDAVATDFAMNAISFTYTLAPDLSGPPAAPIDLTATLDDSAIILNWPDSVESDLASYHVYRSTSAGSYGTPLANVTSSNYTDTNVNVGTTYYYTVTALDDTAQESASSNEVVATAVLVADRELVVNGNFSTGVPYSDLTPFFETAYWERTVGKTAPWLTSSEFDNVGSGNQALVYKTGTTSRGTVGQKISVTAGSNYTCSLRCKTYRFIANRPARVNLIWFTSAGTLIQTDEGAGMVPLTDWTTVTGQVVAPANAAYATVDVGIDGAWSLTKIYIDDISVIGPRGTYNLPATFPHYPLAYNLPITLVDQELLDISLHDFVENKEATDAITYTMVTGPSWLSLSSDGNLTGQLLDPADAGTFTLTVEVNDGSTTVTQDLILVVTPQLRLNNVYNNNMVLQRDETITFRGHSYPNQTLEVQVGGGPRVSTTCANDGTWAATYPAQPANSTPSTIDLYANGFHIAYTNILIGDIWICSGQSNMEYSTRGLLGSVLSPEEFTALMASADNYPTLRFLTTPRTEDDVPWEDLEQRGNWLNSDPTTAAEFSSVGYFFGKHLQDVNVPIGLINSSKGGSAIKQWSNQLNGGTNRYNSKIHPFTQMPIKGVVWLQGEADIGAFRSYKYSLETLITDWRFQWQQPLPFYIVQLAPHYYSRKGSPPYALPELWEQQAQASQEIPNCGLVVTHDTVQIDDSGNYVNNIHPPFKEEVGRRIALWAKHDIYNQPNLVHSGPVPRELVQEGNQLRIYFEPTTSHGLISADSQPLTWFEVAGKDHLYVPATKVTIDGETLLVSASSITQPTSLRYGWNETAVLNFRNAEGLPASAFRIDVKAPDAFRRELLQNGAFNPGPSYTGSNFDVPFWDLTYPYFPNAWLTDGDADPLIGAGNYAVEFVRLNNTVSQVYPAQKGLKYDFSVDVMLTEANAVAVLQNLWIYDDGTTEEVTATINQTDRFLNAPAPNQWVTLSGTLEAPNSEKTIISGKIILITKQNSISPSIYFDNASVKEHLLDISYANWQEDLGQSYPSTEDADGDGLTNLEEYAFNLNPSIVDWKVLTKGTGTEGSPNIMYLSGNPDHLETEYVRRKASDDLLYITEVSTDLQNWNQANLQTTVESIDENWERVKVQDLPENPESFPARFMRFKLQQQ